MSKIKRKSQISLEFTLIISFLLIVLITVESIIADYNYKQRISLAIYNLKNYLKLLSNEFILAKSSYPVFIRRFVVLNHIGKVGLDFQLYTYTNHTDIVLKTTGKSPLGDFVYYLPFVVYGDICEGKCNTIIKYNETKICINNCSKSAIDCSKLPASCI